MKPEARPKGRGSSQIERLIFKWSILKTMNEELGIQTSISYEDPRYPILVLQSDKFGIVGYNLDVNSGELTRVCLCHAHCDSECVCGSWDYDDHFE